VSTQLGRTTVVNGNPQDLILVAARNLPRVIFWCQRYQLDHRAPNVKFIWHADHLFGAKDVLFVDLGDADPELSMALRQLQALGHISPLFVKE